MLGLNVTRASYFAIMGSYILAHAGCAKDLLKLRDYKKQEYLIYRGNVDMPEDTSATL